MYTYIWEYIVIEDQLSNFKNSYGSNGAWELLFKLGNGYIKTELHHDLSNQKRLVTIDYWRTKTEYDEFRAKYKLKYEMLDKECENLTEKEKFIGDFDLIF